MIRNNYEDTIFSITNKLNDKLDNLLMQSNQDNTLMVDDVIIQLAEVTSNFNNLLMELTKRNTMIKEFVTERNKHEPSDSIIQ